MEVSQFSIVFLGDTEISEWPWTRLYYSEDNTVTEGVFYKDYKIFKTLSKTDILGICPLTEVNLPKSMRDRILLLIALNMPKKYRLGSYQHPGDKM